MQLPPVEKCVANSLMGRIQIAAAVAEMPLDPICCLLCLNDDVLELDDALLLVVNVSCQPVSAESKSALRLELEPAETFLVMRQERVIVRALEGGGEEVVGFKQR